MTYETLLFERRGHTALVTLNRPERQNALNEVMHNEVREAWQEVNRDDDIWTVIVTGAGQAFCGGVDLDEVVGAQAKAGVGTSSWEKGGDHLGWFQDSSLERELAQGVPYPTKGYPGKPLIGAINGLCSGIGLRFVTGADFAICSEDAEFFDPVASIGLAPVHETLEMTRTVPRGIALAIAFMGAKFRLSAQRAYEIGLVTEVTPKEQLLERALEIADTMNTWSAPMAVRAAKANIWSGFNLSHRDASVFTRLFLNQVRFQTEDAKEGPRAFVEKRTPEWKGK